MNLKAISVLFLIASVLVSCGSEKEEKESKAKTEKEKGTPDDGRGAEYELYMNRVDKSDSLLDANTLYYTKDNGESYQVYVKLNEDKEVVRVEEKYTTSANGSVLTNYYYFKDGVKYATKEHYIEGSGDQETFVERVSYYEDQKPKISKIRRARFEEYLENELFEIIPAYDCSDERAMRALRREGEFQTNFVSVVREDPAIYIIVGEGTDDGYVSALVVQRITPLIQQMMNNPASLEGQPLSISFQEVHESNGFTFQALLDVQRAE